jgi:hypothetical protein
MFVKFTTTAEAARQFLLHFPISPTLPNFSYTSQYQTSFYVLLTAHLDTILINDHLDAQFFFIIRLFQSSACFGQPRAHHQENQLYQYNVWYMSLCVGGRLVCRWGRNWWWGRGSSKHVEDWNKHIRKNNCASNWSFARIIPRCTANEI